MKQSSTPSLAKANTLLSLQFLSDFGDQITAALLALSVLEISKSTSKVGLVYLTTTLGFLLFTFVGGLIGDKLSKRNILMYSDLGRGLVVLLIILALKEKSISLIYISSFALSILGSLHRPVKLTIWATGIPNDKLERFNSLSELSIHGSTIIGPLIASIFIGRDLVELGFFLDAVTFFICALTFALIIVDRKQSASFHSSKRPDIWAGFKHIIGSRIMSKYVAYDAVQMIGFGAFNATFLVLAQRDFLWSKSEYSYHLTICACFALAGSLLGATEIVSKISSKSKLVFCALLSAVALGLMLGVKSFPVASLLYGVCDLAAIFTVVITRTKVQLEAKRAHHGSLASILAARSIIIKGATLLGAGACLLVDDFISLQGALSLFVIPIAFGAALPFLFKRHPGGAVYSVSVPQKTLD